MEKKLANGMTATYLDESKKLAADRWLVRLRCRVAIPLQGWMLVDMAGDDPQTLYCREQLDGRLAHDIVQERNFIDAGDKERVMAEIIERLEDTVLVYLSTEAFVRQLFTVQLAKLTQRYAQLGWTARLDEGEDITEPADFSACFR